MPHLAAGWPEAHPRAPVVRCGPGRLSGRLTATRIRRYARIQAGGLRTGACCRERRRERHFTPNIAGSGTRGWTGAVRTRRSGASPTLISWRTGGMRVCPTEAPLVDMVSRLTSTGRSGRGRGGTRRRSARGWRGWSVSSSSMASSTSPRPGDHRLDARRTGPDVGRGEPLVEGSRPLPLTSMPAATLGPFRGMANGA